jgi:alkylation response protein AidB-like acyl-CoA dehydrogenase
MRSIAMLGSEEQKRRWLSPMARLAALGAFALTEPDHGSESVALETSARRDGDSYVINGRKKWIGDGSIADVVAVWARDVADGQVKGCLVERGASGYRARVIEGKGAVWAHNTTTTREVLAEARDLLGGNGILLDFHMARHMADIEAIHTFEGTAAIQTLIVGRDIKRRLRVRLGRT